MLPGGRTATNPAGDMRALATSLPALVRRHTAPAALSLLCQAHVIELVRLRHHTLNVCRVR